jgi:hypothetical protein
MSRLPLGARHTAFGLSLLALPLAVVLPPPLLARCRPLFGGLIAWCNRGDAQLRSLCGRELQPLAEGLGLARKQLRHVDLVRIEPRCSFVTEVENYCAFRARPPKQMRDDRHREVTRSFRQHVVALSVGMAEPRKFAQFTDAPAVEQKVLLPMREASALAGSFTLDYIF